MKCPRIYHSGSEPLQIHKSILLSESAARHIGLVLRLSLKEKIILFNGDGYDYLSEIIEIQKKKIRVNIIKQIKTHTKSILSLHLGQAISASYKMDWAIQKAVELGVHEITPLITKHVTVKASAQKLAHWQGIIISACEQCGRNSLPVLRPVQNLAVWLDKLAKQDKAYASCNLIFDPESALSLAGITPPPENTPIHLLMGPEGGFSREEVKFSAQYHFQSVKLGNRILRTETATVAALSALHTLFGDFR